MRAGASGTRGLPSQWRDAGVLQDQYAWDANGNVASIADQQEGLTSRSMGYDALDRLTSASGIWGTGSYGYDALDNLRTSTVGGRTAVATLDSANRLAGLTVNGVAQSYGYDANGNLTSRGAQAFSFDIGNRLSSAPGKASYAYDGHGRRTWVAYADGSWKLQVYGSSGRLLFTGHSSQGNTRHVYLGSRLIAEDNSVSGTSYSHTDALGSPVARTNSAGQVTSRTRYEPYGATAAGTNPTGIGFTGHVNDADTGLVYMQQRYYEPVAGRFLSVDPVTTDANGGSFNRYLYANGNPYRYVDPDGRQSKSDLRYFGSGSVLPDAPEQCESGRNCEQDLGRERAKQYRSNQSSASTVGQAATLKRVRDVVSDYVDAMRDVCPECSRSSFNRMNLAVSHQTADQAGLAPGVLASYDAKSNTATFYQSFFARNSVSQASTVFHEYLHSLPGNQELFRSATIEQGQLPHPQRPWETPVIRLEMIFQQRFGQDVWSKLK